MLRGVAGKVNTLYLTAAGCPREYEILFTAVIPTLRTEPGAWQVLKK